MPTIAMITATTPPTAPPMIPALFLVTVNEMQVETENNLMIQVLYAEPSIINVELLGLEVP